VTITDGLNINFDTNGPFEVGDEVRFQARGYRGDYSVFGQYTDPAFPTTFEVEVTTTGDVDGAARLQVKRLDTGATLATGLPAGSTADVGNIGGDGYLELGVFMQFDANNNAGEAHRLYQGDKFYIDVVGSLSQNFAAQIILESEDNISIEYADLNVDNQVGRLLYVGDIADVNNPGTLTSLQSASLGVNTEFSVAKMDFGTQIGAEEGLRLIDGAIGRINEARTKTGAVQNRLQREITSLEESLFQTQRFNSRIRDADFAHEVARQTKSLIIQQASSSMLSQINNFGQYGLQLVQSLTST
jgi:flagellin-like hook-associated protein FlgL